MQNTQHTQKTPKHNHQQIPIFWPIQSPKQARNMKKKEKKKNPNTHNLKKEKFKTFWETYLK